MRIFRDMLYDLCYWLNGGARLGCSVRARSRVLRISGHRRRRSSEIRRRLAVYSIVEEAPKLRNLCHTVFAGCVRDGDGVIIKATQRARWSRWG